MVPWQRRRSLNSALSLKPEIFLKARSSLCLTFALLVVWASGCGRSGASLGARNSKLFQSADAQTKGNWETAMAALKTNGFLVSIVALQSLQQRGNLTPEQLKAVNETVTAVSDEMYAAANRGDANAKQQIQDLGKLRSRP